MRHIDLAAWILIAGFTLIIALSDGASDDRAGKAGHPSLAAQHEPSATASVPDEQKGKPMQQGVASQGEQPTPALGMPEYKPPPRGAPGDRVGGGSRGTEDDLPMLYVLAPDHIGLTVQEQPSLYWYLSKSTTYPVEVTIIDDQAIQPLIETRIRPPVQPGVQRVRLADYGVHLSPGMRYKWFVAVVVNPDSRSRDRLAGGTLERVELPEVLRAKLAQAGKPKAPHLYAEAGLWYDAVTAISDLIEAAPQDMVLRKQRASLLEQVDLPEIAGYDLRYSRAE